VQLVAAIKTENYLNYWKFATDSLVEIRENK